MIVEKYEETCWDVKFVITENRGENCDLRVPYIRTFNDKKMAEDYIKELKKKIIPSARKKGLFYLEIIIEGPYQSVREKILNTDSLIEKLNQLGYKVIKEE